MINYRQPSGIVEHQLSFFQADSIRRRILKYKWFTLLELLITISVIIVLLALLLPALKKSREKAQDILCKGNLKQSGLGHFLYINDYNEFLPANAKASSYPGCNLWSTYMDDYIKNKNVCRCPSALPNYFDYRYCYGSQYNRVFIKAQTLCNSNPSYYPLLADASTTSYTLETSLPYWQFWAISYSDYTSTASGSCIFLRHGTFANVFLGDGKVEQVNKIKMLNPPYSWTINGAFRAWIIAGHGDF